MNELEQTNLLIERVKIAKSSLSLSLREDLVRAGQKVVRPLITVLPYLHSYVLTADILETIGVIGGSDAVKTLSVLLEDFPEGNLPKRLISQSCIRGLSAIADAQCVNEIIRALSFVDPEVRYTAAEYLLKIALTRPESQQQITLALIKAYERESFEKTGKIIEMSLEKLGQNFQKKSSWRNKTSVPLVIEPLNVTLAPPPAVFKPDVCIQTQQDHTFSQNHNPDSLQAGALQTQCQPADANQYAFTTPEQEQEILNKLLTSPDNTEKLSIIEELGNSGNISVIDELLTVIKSSSDRNIKLAAVDAILKIAPNDMKLRFLVLEYILDKRVIGQQEAKLALANALRIAQIGLKRGGTSTKPIGSFMFLGPTGVGKTELAKALAEALYGNELQLIRLDMSEYTDMSDKNKMIGSPPGYAGCDEGGRLTQEVLKKPQSVILFDEIEKAHPEIFNLFLQVLDDGRLTDSKGVTVSFRDTIILMTSNVGSQQIMDGLEAKLTISEIKELVNEAIKLKYKPEFINRLNDYIIFKPLSEDELLQVLNIKLNPTAKQLSEKYQLALEVTDNAKNYIITTTSKQEFGFSPRELTRIIDNEIVQTLSERLLDLEITESYQNKAVIPRGGRVIVDYKENKIVLDIVSQ